jgi:hypothetical protein
MTERDNIRDDRSLPHSASKFLRKIWMEYYRKYSSIKIDSGWIFFITSSDEESCKLLRHQNEYLRQDIAL